jgi:lactate dehydrogenase-like 2-hydroxyacid dehydrogenase
VTTLAQLDQDPRLAATIRGIVTRSNYAVPAELIDRLPALRIIATCGVGYDQIPLDHARARRVVVTNTPDVLNAAVAELGVGLLLGLLRKLPAADRHVREARWPSSSLPLATSLAGKRVGIAGMGRIGQELARRLAPFDVALGYYARQRRDGLSWHFDPDLTGLARWADILILLLPGSAQTARIVDAAVLDALGPEGYLVNIARGIIVDEAALIDALTQRRIAGAALDVFDAEPDIDPRFFTLDNVVLTPHIGSATRETRAAMMQLTLDNLDRFLTEGRALTPVEH